MCELFGVSSKNRLYLNPLLKEFFSHSEDHPHGWGMALFDGRGVSLEKEPIMAKKSLYLRQRLRSRIYSASMMAHIRLATMGNTDHENTHPFLKYDDEERPWTMVHNGTIFDFPVLDPYIHKQEGETDSERLLMFLITCLNNRRMDFGRSLNIRERFKVIENVLSGISSGNKINLLMFDGDYMYVHVNVRESLFCCRYLDEEQNSGLIFSTRRIGNPSLRWNEPELAKLLVYKDGELIYQGKKRGSEFIDSKERYKELYINYAML